MRTVEVVSGFLIFSFAVESSRLPQRFIGHLTNRGFRETWIAMSGLMDGGFLHGEPPRRGNCQIDRHLRRTADGCAFDAEVPLESNKKRGLCGGFLASEFDMVVFLTGVGTRALLGVWKRSMPRQVCGGASVRESGGARTEARRCAARNWDHSCDYAS